MLRYFGIGIFLFFVFEDDVASVVGSAENIEQSGVVCGDFFAVDLGHDFDLGGDSVGGDAFQLHVGKGSWGEVGRVPNDAEPGSVEPFDDGEEVVDLFDKVVIFEAKDDAFF